MVNGMSRMTHRTTFALDDATASRLKRLASRLGVSQAEIVRRSVEEMERILASEKPDPTRLLRELHEKGGGLASEEAAAYLTAVREDRKQWRGG